MSVIVNDKSLVAQRIQITGADHPKFEVLLSVPGRWEEMTTLWDKKIPFDAEDHQNISRFLFYMFASCGHFGVSVYAYVFFWSSI